MSRWIQKMICIIMCIFVCVSFCSCQMFDTLFQKEKAIGMPEDISLGYTKMKNCDFEYSEYYKNIECTSSYDRLENADMQTLYKRLYESVYYVYPKSNGNGEYKTKQVVLEDVLLTESQIRLTIKALCDDNPEIFFISSTFGFLISKEKNYTCVQLYSSMSPDELQTAINKLKETVDGFYSTLRAGLSPYQLEVLIHDYILATCQYDKSVVLNADGLPKNDTHAFSSYGALVDKKAVCEGYSRAFQLLLCGVGVKTINVIGESQGELHMWNAVLLDGDYYFVDVTWDDSDNKALTYDYFNISEKQLLKDHEFSKLYSEMTESEICGSSSSNALTSNFFIPDCYSTAYNYFVREAPHLRNFNHSDVKDALYESALDKEEYFHIYIDPDEFEYENAIDLLFYLYPQYFFSYVRQVNYSLSDYSIDIDNLTILRRDNLFVVTVGLEYV